MTLAITPWRSQVNPIIDGEEVRQAIANRYPNQLKDRTEHLKQRLDNMEDGQAIYLRGAAMASTVKTGHFVYWDAAALEYKSAIAALVYDSTIGGLIVAPSSYAVGIVISKAGATRGDILQIGFLTEFDFTNTIGTTGSTAAEAGAYYLSGTTAGKAVKQKPPVGIYLMYLRGDSSAHISPAPREVLEDHIHFVLDLYAQPAGTIECAEPHHNYAFITPDETLPGWLPADHASFNGAAPSGAVFGYNLAMHPELERVWPPFPIDGVYIERDGIGENPAYYTVDKTTIWWNLGCYGKAPWSPEITECGIPVSSSSSSSSSSSDEPGPTPRECESGGMLEQMGYLRGDPFARRLRIYFTKMLAKTSNVMVTSLRAATGSPITVQGCNNEVANTGDLQVGINLALNIVENQAGYQALKGVSGLTFSRGPIIEAIKAGTNIEISPVTGQSIVDAQGYIYGRAVINAVLPGSDQQEGQIVLVSLDKAREDVIDDLFVISFPVGIDSAFRGKIDVPRTGVVANPQMQLWFWLLASSAGVLPALSLSYRRLPRPLPIPCAEQEWPETDTDLSDLDAACGSVSAKKYVEATGEAFDVQEGDQINFRLGRLSSDTYAGKVSVVRMGFRIVAGT
jgi:hypothetical protein